MKKMLCVIMAAAFMTSSVYALPQETSPKPLEVYVQAGATDGDGSFEKPFATLDEAQMAVRNLKNKANAGINVFIREGVYPRSKALELTAEDSGSEGAPIVWQAYRDENVTISGGSKLTLDQFEVADDANIHEAAKGKVYKVNLKALGVDGYGELSVLGHGRAVLPAGLDIGANVSDPQIIFDGETTGSLAKYPNDGYMTVDTVTEYGDKPGRWNEPEGSSEYVPPEKRHNPPVPPSFGTDDERLKAWGNAKDAWLFGYWRYDWSEQTIEVDSIDVENGVIKCKTPSAYSILLGQRFYIYNLLEELDVPGEWYYDDDSGYLYVYPKNTLPTAEITLAFAPEDIIKMTGVSYVEIRRLNFTATRACAINMAKSENCAIKYCEVSNVSNAGIWVETSKNIEVRGNHVYNTGTRGIALGGGDLQTLEKSGNVAVNNWIHDFAKITKTYQAGIELNGVGATAKGNLIYNAPHVGIRINGNDHLIEDNEMHSVMKEAADMGAIYTGRNMVARGTVIRNNVIHDLKSDSSQSGKYVLYLDDCQAGYTFENNIMYNIDGTGVFINGGRDNNVTGNIFANMTGDGILLSDWGRCFGVNGWSADSFDPSYYKLDSVDYKSEAYSKYPNLANILEDEPLTAKYNKIEDNVSYKIDEELYINTHPEWGSDMSETEMREKNPIEKGYVINDESEFVNVSGNNFTLKNDSSVFEALPDFENINMDKIGLITTMLQETLQDSVVMKAGRDLAYAGWERSKLDENINIAPFKDGDALYIPVRFVADAFGAEVSYEDGKAIIKNLGDEFSFEHAMTAYTKNGEAQELSFPAIIKEGRTFIAATDLANILAKKLIVNGDMVILSTDDIESKMSEDMLIDLNDRI